MAAEGATTMSADDYDETMRNYAIMIEYKHLKEHVPRGVFVLPSAGDIRLWHGVVFVDQGPFANGVFKFRLQLPPSYPSGGAGPSIVFTSQVFHPYVDDRTGKLDLPHRAMDASALVQPALADLVNALYKPASWKGGTVCNQGAARLLDADRAGFLQRATGCVKLSRQRVYTNEADASLAFSKYTVQHDLVRRMILGAGEHAMTGRMLDDAPPHELHTAGEGASMLARRAVARGGRAPHAETPSPSAVPPSAAPDPPSARPDRIGAASAGTSRNLEDRLAAAAAQQ